MIGGGAPTALGVPLMLTGYQYDTTHSLADYRKKAYEEGTPRAVGAPPPIILSK